MTETRTGKGFALYLNTNKVDKYKKYIESLPGVELVIHCDDWQFRTLTRFLVKTKRRYKLSYFKKVPYNVRMTFYDSRLIKEEDSEDDYDTDSTCEEVSEEDPRYSDQAIRRNDKLGERMRTLYRNTHTQADVARLHRSEVALENARLRKELDQYRAEMMIGFGVDLPDDSLETRPEKRYFSNQPIFPPEDFELKKTMVQDYRGDPIVLKIRLKYGEDSKVEDDYFRCSYMEFLRRYPDFK